MKSLKDLKIGETAQVVKVTGSGPIKRRIMDMGITKGAEIYVRKVAPLGDPMEVTVKNYELSLRKQDQVEVMDLPGIYSLSPYTLEEVIARDYLIQEKPDVILNIVDATNLERNLYLTSQLLELGIPVVVALNFMDIVRKNQDELDLEKLSGRLNCEVVGISALKEEGIDQAIEACLEVAGKNIPAGQLFSGPVEQALARIGEVALQDLPQEKQRWYALKLFERDEKILAQLALAEDKLTELETAIRKAETELEEDAEVIITNERYAHIAQVLDQAYQQKSPGQLSRSDRIDQVFTNRWLALPIFAAIMTLVFYLTVSTVGTWATDWANDGLFGEGWHLFGLGTAEYETDVDAYAGEKIFTPELEGLLEQAAAAQVVGAVLGFVPQMIVLFLLLGFLELSGYMARVAFILDRVFRKFGLSGKSFIPMLISIGCGVPGIMASRTIENERDRRMTIMTATFIPCGAKLPIIVMIATALFDGAWWFTPLAYFIGIAAIIISGIMLKKTRMFAGDPAPLSWSYRNIGCPSSPASCYACGNV